MHILFEFVLLLNLLITIAYWLIIHSFVISNFKGAAYVHMYLVHTFPLISTFLVYKSFEIELCTHHWIIFLPIVVLYAFINYLET